jgi:mRNA-degrading endonuclease toxin of MazEF toxin-antitoxin module
MIGEVARGDVVLVAFPFIAQRETQRKLRPALVVQADRYNRRRSAVVIAAITSTRTHTRLPCKLLVERDSPDGRQAGLRLDSVVDCQTLATVPKEELVRTLGRFSAGLMGQVDGALADALGLAVAVGPRPG